jgi:cation diffusion facilitator family transporter
LTAMGIGALLLYVSFDIATDAIRRFGSPVVPEVNFWSYLIMIITVMVNIFVTTYEYREGKRLKSDFLVTDSLHTRSDILVSCSVIVTLVAVKLGIPILDTLSALFIAGFIAFSAYEVLWQTSRVLSDAAMIDQEKIRKVMGNFKSVEKCHKIRSRGREDSITVDMHIHVKPSMNIEEAHKLSHEIESKIREAIPGVKEVITHIEPSQ